MNNEFINSDSSMDGPFMNSSSEYVLYEKRVRMPRLLHSPWEPWTGLDEES
jgi:hypothetical protein